jgi:large subunit ribosomal protein L28
MSRRCEVNPAKGVLYGNQVSHSNRKSSKRFLPNLQAVSLYSDALKESYNMRVSTHTLRSIEHHHGFDGYLLSTHISKLSLEAQKIKKRLNLELKNVEKNTAA